MSQKISKNRLLKLWEMKKGNYSISDIRSDLAEIKMKRHICDKISLFVSNYFKLKQFLYHFKNAV